MDPRNASPSIVLRRPRSRPRREGSLMTDTEMNELWETMRPYCVELGVTREQFEIGTRIIEAIETPEQAEALARALKEPGK